MQELILRLRKKLKILYSLGITPSTAINMFYHQVIVNNGIPFELKGDVPNKKTIKAIKEVERMEKHPRRGKPYKDADSLMDDLLK